MRAAITWPVSSLWHRVRVSVVLLSTGLVSMVRTKGDSMSKFLANCVVMGVKSKPSQDGTRTYRTAMLYFDDDTISL